MSNFAPRVLLVEDEPADALLVRLRLESLDPPGRIVHEAGTVAEAVDYLSDVDDNALDAVLLDLGLPDGRGLGVVERVLQVAGEVPVIVLTGREGDAGPEAVATGAQDYLVKGDTDAEDLKRAVRYAVMRQRAGAKVRQANRDIEHLVYTVTHDLKNPLMVASGFVGVVLERHRGDLPEDVQAALERVVRQHDRMTDLIADLLNYARALHGELQVQPNDLGRLISRVSHEEGVADRLDVRVAELPKVMADPRLLRQVVANILVNAAKYAATERSPFVEVSASDVGWGVRVRFADNGPGIPQDRREAMFEMFQRGRGGTVEGTGVGLAIVKRALERHDGTARLEDGVDGGIAVVVTFPHDPDEQRSRA